MTPPYVHADPRRRHMNAEPPPDGPSRGLTHPSPGAPPLFPVLAAARVLPLIAALCILRGWSIARGLALLLATVAAIVALKEERHAACTEIVDLVTRKDEPPDWLHRRPVRVIVQPPEMSTSSVPATAPPTRSEVRDGSDADAITFTK